MTLGRLKNSPRQLALSGLGLAAFVALLVWGGRNALDGVTDAHWGYLGAFFVVAFISKLVSAARWALILNWFLGHTGISFRTYYRSFVLARVTGTFTSQAVGDLAVRPAIHGLSTRTSYLDAFAGSVAERLFDISLAVSMSVPAALYLFDVFGTGWLVTSQLAIGAVWTATAIKAGPALLRLMGRFINKIESAFANFGANRILRLVSLVGQLIPRINQATKDGSAVTKVALISLFRYLTIGLFFVSLAYGLKLGDIGFVEIMVAMPLVQIATVLAITPGGIGFLEGGFWGVFVMLGVSSEYSATYLVNLRVLSTLVLLAHGVLSLVIPTNREPKQAEPDVSVSVRE